MRFVQLANHFGREYRHRIIAMDGVTTAFQHLAAGVDAEVISVPVRRGKTLGNLLAFRRLLQSLRPDLLVTCNWGTIEWAAASLGCGVSHIHIEDGFGSDEAEGQFLRRIWARRILLRHAHTILPSQTLFRIARDVWRLPETRITHIPNGIDCERFSVLPDTALLARLGIHQSRPVIGTVAPLRPEKNLRRLIRAFAMVRSHGRAQLLIVGDGPERESLATCAAELRVADDVIFTGFCAAPEKLLRACTVFAIASDTEQMPLSLLEAMAAARPVAATCVGDIRNMLAPENAAFVVRRDSIELARAISQLVGTPGRAAEIGAANCRRAHELFDQRRMFRAYREIYERF